MCIYEWVYTQNSFRQRLVAEVAALKDDAQSFRIEWDVHGPMTPGLEPIEAERCLKKFQPAFEVYVTQHHGTLSYCGWNCCYALEASPWPCKHLVQKHRDAEIQAVAVQFTL